jgi:hypothetical protein
MNGEMNGANDRIRCSESDGLIWKCFQMGLRRMHSILGCHRRFDLPFTINARIALCVQPRHSAPKSDKAWQQEFYKEQRLSNLIAFPYFSKHPIVYGSSRSFGIIALWYHLLWRNWAGQLNS